MEKIELKSVKYGKSSGFTLIELVVVIVLLGILSSVALGKFRSLGTTARAATVQALAGALRTTAEIVHMKCIMTAACNENASTELFTMEDGITYRLNFGWPDAGHSVSGLQIDALVVTTGYKISEISNGTTLFVVESAADPANCSVAYSDAYYGGGEITIMPKTSGC